MKLFFVIAVAAALSTAAFAGNSDRHNDVRLHTANAVNQSEAKTTTLIRPIAKTAPRKAIPVFSSRNKPTSKTKGEGFPFGGYGDGNDSR